MSDHVVRLPRRDVLLKGGAGVLGMIIGAATLNVAGAQTPSVANVKANIKRLRMGDFNPNYATQWSYRLAQALGYLKEVGIEDFQVTLSDQYVPGLIGGSLDIVHGDTSTIFAAGSASKLPIKIISVYRDSEWWIMGARKGIETAADVKGKKVTGGQLDARNTWVMKQVLKAMGLDPQKDVSFVPTSGASDNRLQALIAGTIDAGSLFPRHKAPLEKAGGKFIYEKLNPAPQEAFATMGTWADKNEATVQAWVLADIKARRWLFDPANKEKAYQHMIDLGFTIPPSFKANYQVELDQISKDGGFESAAVMEKFIEGLSETGEVPKGLDWKKFVDMKYVWAAQKALGMPQRPASL
jgi:ABC-type nitrate/sulfonate/bicarbonate transport system substrate-binding protein